MIHTKLKKQQKKILIVEDDESSDNNEIIMDDGLVFDSEKKLFKGICLHHWRIKKYTTTIFFIVKFILVCR